MAYRYMILDSQHRTLARAYLESPPDAKLWEIRVIDEGIEAVMEHELIQLVGIDDNAPAMVGRIMRQRGDKIALEPVEMLGDDIRQNLRVHVRFETYLYSLNDRWQGRIPVVSHDLSCGGTAFYSVRELQRGDLVEIVIPITEHPIILKARVVRPRPSNQRIQLYAAKFVDLINDEERMVREAVFGHQILSRGI